MDDFVAQFLNRLKMQHYRGFDPIGYVRQVGSNFKSPQNLSPGFTHHFKMLTTKQYLLRSTQHPQGDFNVHTLDPGNWPKIGAMILLLTLCKRKLKCCIRILGDFIISLGMMKQQKKKKSLKTRKKKKFCVGNNFEQTFNGNLISF